MRRINMFLSALSFASLISGATVAADLDTIIPAAQEDPYVPVEVGSGWYIRGDISYDMSSSTTGDYRTYDGVSYSNNAYDKFNLSSTHNLGVGIGYQFNSFLRADATVSSWSRLINGRDTSPISCDLSNVLVTGCRSEDSTKATAYELMANAYADLGTFVGVTPYVGAGAGFTRLKYGSLTNVPFCTGAAGDITGGACPPATTLHAGLASYRFTYALMAGASYDISRNMKFDLGYRYSRVAGGDMFNFDAGSTSLGATGVQGKDKGFSTHEIKAGIRYEIW